ncbi:MAG: hypothetical protein JW783_00440 [Bacteroidales bacterium]|nr:hypothetical protein [Bacteroidales bacterium]MBN2748489.1 hypothetical protein [Bacteroidales bacterium]
MILAIDFDGTIVRGKFPNIDGLVPDAKLYIPRLKKAGHYIIINTCRSGDLLTEAINYLLQHEIPFDRVNDNHPDTTKQYNNNSRKVYAHCYIDDKNLGGFPGWAEAYDAIMRADYEYKQQNEQQ